MPPPRSHPSFPPPNGGAACSHGKATRLGFKKDGHTTRQHSNQKHLLKSGSKATRMISPTLISVGNLRFRQHTQSCALFFYRWSLACPPSSTLRPPAGTCPSICRSRLHCVVPCMKTSSSLSRRRVVVAFRKASRISPRLESKKELAWRLCMYSAMHPDSHLRLTMTLSSSSPVLLGTPYSVGFRRSATLPLRTRPPTPT